MGGTCHFGHGIQNLHVEYLLLMFVVLHLLGMRVAALERKST